MGLKWPSAVHAPPPLAGYLLWNCPTVALTPPELEKPEAFGPGWMVSFSIAPVVKNGLAGWFGLGKD